jgi:hypothetical protein
LFRAQYRVKLSVYAVPQRIDKPSNEGGEPDVPIPSNRSPPARPRHSIFGWLAMVTAGITGLWLSWDYVIASHWQTAAWSWLMPLGWTLYQARLAPGAVGIAFGAIGFIEKGRNHVLNKIAILVILEAYLVFMVADHHMPV